MPKLARVDLYNTVGRPWDLQPGEPGNWFLRFNNYITLGTVRTIEAVYEQEKSKAIKAGKYTMKAVPMLTSWKAVARQWAWEDRAALFDAEQVTIVRAEQAVKQQVIARDAEVDRVIQREKRQELIDIIYAPVLQYFKEHPVAFANWKPNEQIQLLKLLLTENRTEYEALPGKEMLAKIMSKTNDELLQIIQGQTSITD